VYLNSDGLFEAMAPAIYNKLVSAVKEADRNGSKLLCRDSEPHRLSKLLCRDSKGTTNLSPTDKTSAANTIKVGDAANKVGDAANKVGDAANKVGDAANKVGDAANTVGDNDVHVRCMELHTVRPGGSLADPCHYDWGSLLTLDIMLAGETDMRR
jgi:hypothetical protein